MHNTCDFKQDEACFSSFLFWLLEENASLFMYFWNLLAVMYQNSFMQLTRLSFESFLSTVKHE
uniref:Uncharacterized protein n=1 Tax=Anguilla anguilla TaxID=7936 RepID=A0A0E9X2M1_ANGAN